MKPAPARAQRGFTLLELSIVLTIIAIVVGMSVSMGVSVIDTARQAATQRKMKTIDEALMQYRTANDRLPCPGDLTIAPGAANYGIEAGAGSGSAIGVGTGACTGTGMLPQANFTGAGVINTFQTGAEGALPAVTLGLSPDLMVDGWGNKFRYSVDVSYTALGVFASTGLSCNNGAITVNDVNGNARSANSVYALISSGANGHGAYAARAATMTNAGSVNANELTNCHCSSSAAATTYAPTYVQMPPSIDPINALDNFDDLVSYKERWQMRTDWDKTGSGGCGDVLAVAAGEGSTSPVYFYKLSGTTMTGSTSSWQYGLPYATYSPDGSLLYVTKTYSNTYVYSVASDGITTTGPVATIAPPGNGDNQYDPIVSPDGGYFGIPLGAAGGGVQVYSRSGNTFTPLTDVVLGSNAGVQGETSLDASANHLALGIFGMCSGTAPASPQIYKRSGTSFSLLAGQPDVPFSDTYNCLHTNAKFSPDGAYLYATDGGTDSLGKNFRIYAVSGDTFTYQSGQPDQQPGSPVQIAVNPGNTYIVVSNYGSPYLYIYKRSGSTFTRLSNPATIPNSIITDITFTPDGQYLAITETNTPYLLVYKVNSATDTFTALSAPTLIPAGGAQGISAVTTR